MRGLLIAAGAVAMLSAASLSSHPARAMMPVAPKAIQAPSQIETVACHMRKVCSRVTGKCHMRNVCNTPSRTMPQT
jgi:hypothetical protein